MVQEYLVQDVIHHLHVLLSIHPRMDQRIHSLVSLYLVLSIINFAYSHWHLIHDITNESE